MNGVVGHDTTLQGYTGLGPTRVNEMNFVMDYAPCAGLITQPVNQQSSMVPLCYCCPYD